MIGYVFDPCLKYSILLLSGMDVYQSFFKTAPTISWSTWIQRQIWNRIQLQNPSLLVTNFLQEPIVISSKFHMERALPETSQSITKFLQQYYFEPNCPVSLQIPSVILKGLLETGMAIGILIRIQETKQIVGCVFSLFCGVLESKDPMGLITWLCVHPTVRKQGLVNALLRGIYKVAQPWKIHWWRNDGLFKSPIPPVMITQRIIRKKGAGQVLGSHAKGIRTVKRPFETIQTKFLSLWKTIHPAGIVLNSTQSVPYRLLECWELRQSATHFLWILCQPTFEVQRQDGGYWCEVLGWVVEGFQSYEISQMIECCLESTPYDWFDAPNEMPHLEQNWKSNGYSSWSVFGLDPGQPVQRPILPCINA